MKAKSLQILSSNGYVGPGKCVAVSYNASGEAVAGTHEIERVTEEHGWMVRHRATGEMFFVPDGVAIATLEAEPEVTDDDAPAEPAAKAGRGRGRSPEAA